LETEGSDEVQMIVDKLENNKYKTEHIYFMQHACCDEANLYAETRIRRTSLLSMGASEKEIS